ARDLAGHDRMAAGRTLAEAGQLPLWAPPGAGGGGGTGGEPVEVSPELPTLIAQDTPEPVLREAAVAAGADVRFRTELTGFTADGEGVRAELAGPGGGRRRGPGPGGRAGGRRPRRAGLG